MEEGENKKRNTIKFEFEIDEDDFDKFIGYHNFLDSCIEQKVKIPSRVMSTYFQLMIWDGADELTRKRIDQLSEKVYARYSQNSVYDFTIQKTEMHQDVPVDGVAEEASPIEVEYSLKKMIREGCEYIVREQIADKKRRTYIDRDQFTGLLYNKHVEYIDYIRSDFKDGYRNSRLQTISAYTLHALGYPYAETDNPTNRQLFQKSRNAIKKAP